MTVLLVLAKKVSPSTGGTALGDLNGVIVARFALGEQSTQNQG
jgi:hypothetical protein